MAVRSVVSAAIKMGVMVRSDLDQRMQPLDIIEQVVDVVYVPSHRRRLRTSNMLERLNRELKRRNRVVSIFPNEASLLRLASAVLMEVDEGWMSGKKYLTMETN